jgi:transcriptional regulator with XRE-family HTH domain
LGIDNALATSNPVSRARVKGGYSLEKLGKIVGLSKQYLSRAEHGTYSGLNKELVAWISHSLEMSPKAVRSSYESFQSEQRHNTVRTHHIDFLARKGSLEAGHVLFRHWREGHWYSQIAFCRDLCVHPVSVENYEEGITMFMPAQLQDALREVNLLDPNWQDIPIAAPKTTHVMRNGVKRNVIDVPGAEALSAALSTSEEECDLKSPGGGQSSETATQTPSRA